MNLFFGFMNLDHDERQAYDAYLKQDYVNTIRACQTILRRNPEHSFAIDLSAKSLFNLGKFDAALQGAETLIRLHPDNGDLYGFRGWIYLAMQQSDQALQDLNTAIQKGVRDPIVYYQRSVLYYRQKRFLEALADMNYIMSIWQPVPERQASFCIQRGRIFHRIKEFTRAIEDYSLAIEYEPDNRTAWTNRAWTYSVCGNFDQSNADVEKALSLEPLSPYPYGTLGHTCFLTTRYDEALKHFVRELELKPDHPFAIAGQAITQHALGNVDEARKLWQTLIELDARYATVDALIEDYHPAEAFVNEARKILAGLN